MTSPSRPLLHALLALLGTAVLITSASAQVDTTINQAVWKQIFNVSANVGDANWLAADDDGDGVKNGDELIAGTNPKKLATDVRFKLSSMSGNSTSAILTFPTVFGKVYQAEAKVALTDTVWKYANRVVVGDGNPQTLTVPKVISGVTYNYFHVVVSDQASQGDQVSDWAKHILGFSTSSPITSQSSYTHTTLASALTTQQNVVTLSAPDAATTAPPDITTAATDLGVVRVSRGGYYLFSAITVGLSTSGSAQAGVDYAALPNSVVLPAGVKFVDLNIVPIYNPGRKTNTTVVVTAKAGGGYTVGSPAMAVVTIYPTQTPAGTGLTGVYYVGSSSTYASIVNFGDSPATYSYSSATGKATVTFPTSAVTFASNALVNLKFTDGGLAGGVNDKVYTISSSPAPTTTTLTVPISGTPATTNGHCTLNPRLLQRVDATVDFSPYNASTNPGGWGTGSTNTPIQNSGAYVVRWTGQVQPQYSETYFFDLRSDDGGKVWVNGQLVVDSWAAQSVTDRQGSIDLQAGVLYDIKVEYLQVSGAAEAHLYWYSADQVKQIIPSSRLYPAATGVAGAAPPAITSPSSVLAFLNQAYTSGSPLLVVTASNGPNAFALTAASGPLPTGLALDPNTGAITGTATVLGDFPVEVQATNATGSGTAALDIQVVAGGNAVTREIWTNLGGKNVADLQAVIAANTPVFSTDTSLTSLEDNTTTGGGGSAKGERLRGYLTVPATGNYYFYIAASGDAAATQTVAELWISNNNEPCNKIRRCYTAGPTGTTSRDYLNAAQSANQRSGWLSLVGGQKYYFEVLHNLGTGSSAGNLAVGWFMDPTGSTTVNSGNVGTLVPVVSGAVLSPWDNPATTTVAGSLYVTDLSGLPGVTTSATGSAYLRLTGSSAVVHMTDPAPLTSGIVSRGIYTGSLASPTLVFDLDAQDKFNPTLKTNDGGYTWSGISTNTLNSLTAGTVFLMVKTAAKPTGEVYGMFGLTSGSQTSPGLPTYPAWSDDHTSDAGDSRFLAQASFGASPSDLSASNPTSVRSLGYKGWIDNQFTLGPSYHTPLVMAALSADPTQPYPSALAFNAWWQQSVTAPDQLRQRAAFALSEIMVVSDAGPLNNESRYLSNYYDILLADCFGSFRTLLKDVTLSPSMGVYLDMRANDKGNFTTGLHANENYAREIQQLFSVGLYRLWPDGTLVLDSTGNPVATYGQAGITGFAKVLTGWNWGQGLQANGRLPTSFNPPRSFTLPMTLVPTHHELGSKVGLDNVIFPAANAAVPPNSLAYTPIITPAAGSQADSTSTGATGQPFDNYCLQDLEMLLDQIMNNPSVGPYICRQLIQRLVTSNPKPAYVNRVVRAFNGEQYVDAAGQPIAGDGVKGNLQQILRAILLDSEARGAGPKADPQYGKQREPVLRMTATARAFPAPVTNFTYREQGGQPILITTTAPHRLNNGDSIYLDNFVDQTSGGAQPPPTSQTYTVNNFVTTTYTFDKSSGSGLATIAAPGYQVGDVVPIQFTAGTLNTTAVNTSGPFTVTAVNITPTTTTFTVNVNTTTPANQTSNAAVLLPNTFTVSAGSLSASTYDNTTSGNQNIVTVPLGNSSNYFDGQSVYLKFSSGGLLNAGFDGIYTITVPTAAPNTFTVNLGAATPPAATNGGVIIPRLLAGYTITNSGSTSTITVSTVGSHYLNPGNTVQLNFVAFPNGAVAQAAPSQVYTVASVIDNDHFTVTITNTPTLSQTSQNTSALVVYPLVTPSFYTRNGTGTIERGSFSISYTDSDLTQTPLNSPTVFNFFYPSFMNPGAIATAGMTTPEFQLTNDTNVMNLTNALGGVFVSGSGNPYGFTNYKSGGIMVDLSTYMTPSSTADAGIPGLVDTLSNLYLGGALQPANKTAIVNYVTGFVNGSSGTKNFPYTTPTNQEMTNRVRAIIYLLAVSPDFAIQK